MTPPLENGRARSRKTDEEFVLFLQGIPAHCRWQELKDLVRQTALHIRQAVVYDDQHGFPTGLGQIIVKHEEAAWRTFHKLSASGWDGQSLVVTLARTSSPTHPIAGPTTSPPFMYTGYAGGTGYSTPPRATSNLAIPTSPMSPESPLLPTSPSYPSPEYEYGLSPMGMHHHHHQTYPFQPVYLDPLPLSSPSIPSPFSDHHHHHHHHHHLPAFTILPNYPMPNRTPPTCNSNHAHKPTPTYSSPQTPTNNIPPTRSRRSIFIQNLPPHTQAADLKRHFHAAGAGSATACEVFADRETGRCRGYARAGFGTGEEARRAVVVGDGSVLLGRRIRVRFDRFAGGGGSRAGAGGRNGNGNGNWFGVGGDEKVEGGWEGVNGSAVPVAPAPAPVSGSRCDTVERCQQQQPLVVNGSGAGFGRRVEIAAESA